MSTHAASPTEPLRDVRIELVERLFDQLPDVPFFMKDMQLRYIAANAAMLQLCGASSREAFIGKTASDFFPPALARRYEALDRQVLTSGAPVKDRLELSLIARVKPKWLLYTRWPIANHAGAIAGIAASSRTLPTPDGGHPRYQGLASVVEQMQANFNDPLRVADLARDAGVSASQLQRDFLAIFSLSPQQYLAKVRLEAAVVLLGQGVAIADIAHACGYSDQSAFTRRFRAAVGITPREYRKTM